MLTLAVQTFHVHTEGPVIPHENWWQTLHHNAFNFHRQAERKPRLPFPINHHLPAWPPYQDSYRAFSLTHSRIYEVDSPLFLVQAANPPLSHTGARLLTSVWPLCVQPNGRSSSIEHPRLPHDLPTHQNLADFLNCRECGHQILKVSFQEANKRGVVLTIIVHCSHFLGWSWRISL